MNLYFSRVPEAAVFRQFDGNLYANIPHSMPKDGGIVEDYSTPRMMRFTSPSFIKGGEAYILFAKRGDALPLPVYVPFGVSIIHQED